MASHLPRPGDPAEYLVAHLEEALVRDPRVCELGLRVSVHERTVVVTGCVSTVERHRAVPDVVHDVLPGHHVENRTIVADYPERPEMEMLR